MSRYFFTQEQAAALNDDRFGRALDDLFASDRTALLTDFVLRFTPWLNASCVSK